MTMPKALREAVTDEAGLILAEAVRDFRRENAVVIAELKAARAEAELAAMTRLQAIEARIAEAERRLDALLARAEASAGPRRVA